MSENRRRWVILFSLLFIQIFGFGPTAGTVGVFIDPWVKAFGWSRAEASQMATAYSFALGVFSLVAGWLLERINAKWIMAAGCLMAGAGELLGSQVSSLGAMTGCYILTGAGVALAALTPAAVVAVEWFPDMRGTAVAIAYFGIGIGMAIAPRVVVSIVAGYGWRLGMIWVAIPLLVLAMPVALFLVSSRPKPDMAQRLAGEEVGNELSGPNLRPGMATAAFWMLIVIAVVTQSSVGATFYHMIPYLVMVGYSAGTAALVLGGQAILVSVGSIVLGMLSDRLGPKLVMASSFVLLAIADLLLLVSGDRALGLLPVIAFILLWGTNMGNASVLPPLVAGNLGMRRFSTFLGVITMCWSCGQGVGPIVAGAVFDITHTYVLPFELAAGAFLVGAVLTALLYPAPGVQPLKGRTELAA